MMLIIVATTEAVNLQTNDVNTAIIYIKKLIM